MSKNIEQWAIFSFFSFYTLILVVFIIWIAYIIYEREKRTKKFRNSILEILKNKNNIAPETFIDHVRFYNIRNKNPYLSAHDLLGDDDFKNYINTILELIDNIEIQLHKNGKLADEDLYVVKSISKHLEKSDPDLARALPSVTEKLFEYRQLLEKKRKSRLLTTFNVIVGLISITAFFIQIYPLLLK